jgi:HTH-type transcriptional regulator/antitoxin HigA
MIKTEGEYRKILQKIEGLMQVKANTSLGEQLDVSVTLVEDYECKHYPLDFPDPTEAIKFVMEQKNLTVKTWFP